MARRYAELQLEFTLIIPVMIMLLQNSDLTQHGQVITSILSDKVSYQFPNFNGCPVDV